MLVLIPLRILFQKHFFSPTEWEKGYRISHTDSLPKNKHLLRLAKYSRGMSFFNMLIQESIYIGHSLFRVFQKCKLIAQEMIGGTQRQKIKYEHRSGNIFWDNVIFPPNRPIDLYLWNTLYIIIISFYSRVPTRRSNFYCRINLNAYRPFALQCLRDISIVSLTLFLSVRRRAKRDVNSRRPVTVGMQQSAATYVFT